MTAAPGGRALGGIPLPGNCLPFSEADAETSTAGSG